MLRLSDSGDALHGGKNEENEGEDWRRQFALFRFMDPFIVINIGHVCQFTNLQILYNTFSLYNILSISLLRLIQIIQIFVLKLCTQSNSNGLIFIVRLINVFTYALS